MELKGKQPHIAIAVWGFSFMHDLCCGSGFDGKRGRGQESAATRHGSNQHKMWELKTGKVGSAEAIADVTRQTRVDDWVHRYTAGMV